MSYTFNLWGVGLLTDRCAKNDCVRMAVTEVAIAVNGRVQPMTATKLVSKFFGNKTIIDTLEAVRFCEIDYAICKQTFS